MSCPLPSDFQALVVDIDSPACDQLRKLGRLAETVSNAYACIFSEDMSFTEEFAARICATGCGSSASTSTGGSTSSTTTAAGRTQLYDEPGSYEFVVPEGATTMTYQVVAGGGGGGQYYFPGSPYPGPTHSSGGGSGQMRYGSFAVAAGQTLLIVVGPGGHGKIGSDSVPGSASSISRGPTTLVTANGGQIGRYGVCSSGNVAGGAGGSGGVGGASTPGNPGQVATGSPCSNGSGGDSVGLTAGAGGPGVVGQSVAFYGSHGAVLIAW